MTKLTRQQFYIYRHLGIKPKNLSSKKLRLALKLIAENKTDRAKELIASEKTN